MEMFVGMMEQRRWLATGHARTANARQRSHQAWAEIAAALNSDGSGCVKTEEQWSKYWKDKKGAVKRKMSTIAAARRRTGGGVEDVPELTDIESRIVALMGGESFATGDRHLEINPFSDVEGQSVSGQAAGSSEQSPSILQSCILPVVQSPAPSLSVNIVQEYMNPSAVAVFGDDTLSDVQSPGPSQQQVVADVHPRPSHARDLDMDSQDDTRDEVGVSHPQSPAERGQVDNTLSPTQRRRRVSLSAVRRRVSYESPGGRARGERRRRLGTPRRSPRAGPSAARRRLLRRSPPSQRRSEMASLTERFIAIEERRAEAELILARALETYSQGQQTLTEKLGVLAQSFDTHARALNALVDVFVTRMNMQ